MNSISLQHQDLRIDKKSDLCSNLTSIGNAITRLTQPDELKSNSSRLCCCCGQG
jgi:hypothetical protein